MAVTVPVYYLGMRLCGVAGSKVQDDDEMLDELVGEHMEWSYNGPLFDASAITKYVLRVIKQHESDERERTAGEAVVVD